MKVLDLQCALGHAFEGWFASNGDFDTQRARGLVACPICADTAISKCLSAPRLNLGKGGKEPPAADGPPPPAPATDAAAQARWMHAMRDMLARTEDVGERFADEARRIHHGESTERSIRGQATREQAEALLDEGIAVMPLALPAALKETLQ